MAYVVKKDPPKESETHINRTKDSNITINYCQENIYLSTGIT